MADELPTFPHPLPPMTDAELSRLQVEGHLLAVFRTGPDGNPILDVWKPRGGNDA